MMDVTENGTPAGARLGYLKSDQRRRFDVLDAAYFELLSSDRTPAKADAEALADAIVALYDEIAGGRPALENRG